MRVLAIVPIFAALTAIGAASQPDYMGTELRASVEALKESLQAAPSDASNREARARVLWGWLNAYSLTGATLPVDAPRIVSRILTYGDAAHVTLDAMIREFTLLDEQPDAIGILTADLGPFEARAFVTVRQTYTVGAKAIRPGGGFLVTRHFMPNYGFWQTDDPAADNYISIASSNEMVSFTADRYPMTGMHGGFRSTRDTLVFRVAAGMLHEGDTAVITYGDRSGGSRGFLMADLASDRMPLPLYLDFDGSDHFLTLPIQPIVVHGGSVAGVHGFAPSVLAPGETFELSVRAQDRYYNRATGVMPAWDVFLNGDPFTTISAGPDPITILDDLSLAAPGVYRFTLRSRDGRITGETNPILVAEDPQHRVYWGDTHGHSGFAEGVGTPELFMTWARDDARLDYVMHSEHDVWLDDFEWNVLESNVRAFTEENTFIAYLGYEWSVSNYLGGHHNVLFRTPDDRKRIDAQFYPTLSKLYQGLRTHHDPVDVIVIPHAHQNGEYRLNDPMLEPLIEIMSMHGTFEWFGRMYLSHGHQVGFTAASDNHLSQPGYSAPRSNGLAQRGGLGAILAPERTRDALFDAMKNLKAYATSGDRIILDFRLNGARMGSRTAFSPTRSIRGRVVGTAPIDTVTIIKNDTVVWEQDYVTEATTRPRDGVYYLTFESASDPLHPRDNPRGWRHWMGELKVSGAVVERGALQDFHNTAYQSFELVDPQTIRFHTFTRGDTSSIELVLSDVRRNARIELSLNETRESGGAPLLYSERNLIPAAVVNLALRDMDRGRVSEELPIGSWVDRVSLRRVVDEGAMDIEFSFDDTGELQGDYYYVRVKQLNDAIAWSSPIWVGGYPAR